MRTDMKFLRAFSRDTNATKEHAPTAAHNDNECCTIPSCVLNMLQDGLPQDKERADTRRSALRARERISHVRANWLSLDSGKQISHLYLLFHPISLMPGISETDTILVCNIKCESLKRVSDT